jgi:DNA-binding LytR/AlgR family response regulator
MPPLGSGFDFLEQCHHLGFGVIFVTAYPQYAIKAINDVQPWAYLVKPYSVSELEKGVHAAIEKVEEKKQSVPMDVQRLIVSDARKGNIVIKVVDILYCEADGSTTDIYFFKDGDIVRTVASRTLKDIEENLPSSFFFRSHYSYLVNFIHIIRIERRGRSGVAILSDGTEVPIAVARMEEFEKRFDDFVHLS